MNSQNVILRSAAQQCTVSCLAYIIRCQALCGMALVKLEQCQSSRTKRTAWLNSSMKSTLSATPLTAVESLRVQVCQCMKTLKAYTAYTLFFLLVPTSVSHQLPCLTLRHKALADISQRSDRTTWLKAMISSISAYPPTSNLALSQCTIPVCKRVAVDTFHLSRELCAPMSYTAC